eukprot:204780_1
MSFDFDKIKQIDNNTKLILFGFIRQSQHELMNKHKEDTFYIIPDLITYACLLFYYTDEYFAKSNLAEIIISDNKQTITKRNAPFVSKFGWDNTSYGNLWIDSNENKIIIWTLKMNRTSGDDICIGIVPTDDDMHEDFTLQCANNYSFCTNGIFMASGIHHPAHSVISCRQGDTIQFILDLIESKLKINIIDQDKNCVLCDTIRKAPNIKYKLAISLHYCDDSVTLINYSEKIK